MTPEAAPPDLSFEAALARLEEIVREMEASSVPLQRMLALFEEGSLLGRRCQQLLDLAELRINQVMEESNGAVHLRSLRPDGLGDGADPAF